MIKKFILLCSLVFCVLALSSCLGGKNEICFETNGGTEIEPRISNKIEEPPRTVKDGFVFEGWFKDENYTKKVEFPFRTWKSVTLYAKWRQVNFTVEYQTNGGLKIAPTWVDIIETAPKTTREGYVFEGWYKDSDFKSLVEFPYDVVSDVKFYAKWRQVSFTVEYQTNGGSKIAPTWVDSIETAPKTTREGYVFEGWYKDSDFKSLVEFPYDVVSDVKFYAKWRQIYYIVTFHTNGGTDVTSMWTDCIEKLPLTTRKGYIFDGWYKDDGLVNPASFPLNIDKDTSLYAKWKQVEFTVLFEENGGNYVEDVVTDCLESAPTSYKNGFAFGGWYNDAEFVSKTFFPLHVTRNTTLYAKWLVTKYNLTCNDYAIKSLDSNYYSGCRIRIEPNIYELDELEALGYKNLVITVNYSVHYTKSYDALLDIGYFGAPKYDVSIANDYSTLKSRNNIEATKPIKQNTISCVINFVDLKKDKLYFIIETDNIQNIVHFTNMTVDLEYVK